MSISGLAVAVVALSAASALAKAGGTDRPLACTFSGNARISLEPPLPWAGDGAGVCTHFGEYTVHAEGTSELGPSGLAGTGTTTFVAANGDQITGSVVLTTADPAPGIHTGTVVTTITGGTGRFTDATGVLTTTATSTSFTVVGECPACTVFRNDDVGTITGTISY